MFSYVFSLLAMVLMAVPTAVSDTASDPVLVAQKKPSEKKSDVKTIRKARKKRAKPASVAKAPSTSATEKTPKAPPSDGTNAPSPETSKVDKILSSVQAFYGRTTDLKARFTQTYTRAN